MNTSSTTNTTFDVRALLSKVPEITLYFWLIKIFCTTIGETAADFLNNGLGFGLTNTTYVMAALLAIVLFLQFRMKRYVPAIYWLAVVLLSVFGTLITDNLTDKLGVSLFTSTTVFTIALAIIFAIWYKSEHTLSIHSIHTYKREAFYWLAILFTFALGTAAGDLAAERLQLGYALSVGIFAGLIALIAAAYQYLKFNAIWAFWLAYIMTRPLGASIGDLLSQDHDAGGFGLGYSTTSAIFLVLISGLIIYLTATKHDAPVQKA